MVRLPVRTGYDPNNLVSPRISRTAIIPGAGGALSGGITARKLGCSSFESPVGEGALAEYGLEPVLVLSCINQSNIV